MNVCLLLLLCWIATLFVILPLAKQSHLRVPRWIFFVVIGIFSSSAFTLYWVYGSMGPLLEKQRLDAQFLSLKKLLSSDNVSRESVLVGLKDLEKNMLVSETGANQMARFYQEGGFYPEAILVYDTLLKNADDPELIANWVYCHAMLGEGKLSQSIRLKATNVVKQLASPYLLLNILAVDDYLQGQFDDAMQTWQYLIGHDTSLTEEGKVTLQNAIAVAQQQGGKRQTQLLGFNVKFKIPQAILKQASPDDWLFVYVKSPDAKMPLLVQRIPVKHIPERIRLDNRDSMVGRALKPGMQVILGGHISKDGMPSLKPSDVQGKIGPIAVQNQLQDIELTLNQPT